MTRGEGVARVSVALALLATGCLGASDPTTEQQGAVVGCTYGVCGWFALQARSTGGYVSANYGGYVVADRTAIGPWEKFFFSEGSSRRWYLTASNNQLVSADLTLGGRLVANRNGAGPWEEFEVDSDLPAAPGYWTLYAYSAGGLVSADLTLGGVLIANRSAAGPWEDFNLISVGPP